MHSRSHELSLEWIKRCWKCGVKEQGWRGQSDSSNAGQGSSARQSLVVEPYSSANGRILPVYSTFCSPTLDHSRLNVCSMYLESVVRVDTAPAALLQLHLRVKIFLVLLHYVRQVRTPAALCMIFLAVTVVVVVVLKKNSLGIDCGFILTSVLQRR